MHRLCRAAPRSGLDLGARAWLLLALVALATMSPACARQGAPARSREERAPTTTAAAASADSPAPEEPGAATLPALDSAAAAAARSLVEAEQAIRDPGTPRDAFDRLGRVQQASYRMLVANQAWLPEVLAAAPPELRPSIAALTAAGRGLREIVGTPRDTLPDWEIVPPPPPEELREHYRVAEAQFGVPWTYLAAIHLVETRMGRIRGLSSAGARGPMQFLPATWAAYGEGDIDDARDAILAAARYLHANGAPARMREALYRYNHSTRYVDAVTTYAREMESAEGVYLAFYHWQVYYLTTGGDVLLEEGWRR